MNAPAPSADAADAQVANVFGVTVWALCLRHFLDTTQAKAEALCAAIATLRDAVAIEQKLDLLLSNLVEFERELADQAVAITYWGFQSKLGLLDEQLAFGRRLLNLLSAVRTHVDYVKHHVKREHLGDATAEAAVVRPLSRCRPVHSVTDPARSRPVSIEWRAASGTTGAPTSANDLRPPAPLTGIAADRGRCSWSSGEADGGAGFSSPRCISLVGRGTHAECQ